MSGLECATNSSQTSRQVRRVPIVLRKASLNTNFPSPQERRADNHVGDGRNRHHDRLRVRGERCDLYRRANRRRGQGAQKYLAIDNTLDLDMTSVLYPVWQACVAVRLAMVLRRPQFS